MDNGPGSTVPSRDERIDVERHIKRELLTGFAFALLLVFGNLLFENSPVGRQFELWGDQIFQASLKVSDAPKVIVLNIANIASAPSDIGIQNGDRTPITSRTALLSVVTALASISPAPRAIGIDVDMAPRFGLFADPSGDPGFFQKLMDLRDSKHIRIFVAIFRSTNLPTQYWLGSPRFESLAASAALFTEGVNRTIPASLSVGKDCGQTLSSALTHVTVDCKRRAPFWSFAEPETQWHANDTENRQGYAGQQYVVNYSVMPQLMDTALDATQGSDITPQASRIAGKIVLLGDMGSQNHLSQVPDHCNVPPGTHLPPGYEESDVPCVFVHAAGVYTLMQAPLRRMTPQARVLVDIALAGFVLGVVAMLRWRYERRSRAHVAAERLYTTGFIAFAVMILVLCGFLSRITMIVWDDYILVVIALLFHRPIERMIVRAWTWLRSNLPKFVFEQEAPR